MMEREGFSSKLEQTTQIMEGSNEILFICYLGIYLISSSLCFCATKNLLERGGNFLLSPATA
jgi:hypothetical protein